jgi:hypothetical protein
MRNDDRACDSRRLRSGYQLNAASDIPQDFPIPISAWRAAVFIPGETQEYPQFLAFPPRIYVLTSDTLSVFSYPAFKEAPLVVPLCELLEVELQKASFIGVLRLWRKDGFLRFRYNSVHEKHMNGFLRELRFTWLGRGHAGTIRNQFQFQQALEICVTAHFTRCGPNWAQGRHFTRFLFPSSLAASPKNSGLSSLRRR